MEYLEVLGKGNQAIVYKVRQEGRVLACKVYLDERLRDREYKLLKSVDYDMFPKVYGKADTCRGYGILMEYIRGMNFDKYIAAKGALEEQEALCFAIKTAKGFSRLQDGARPVLYRDLKAENIIIDDDLNIKVIDFGCACFLYDSEKIMAGTKAFSAPEQFVKGAVLDKSCDVYAFGKLFEYMLIGEKPCEKSSKTPCTAKGKMHKNKLFQSFIRICTNENPALRFPDMRYVLHVLEELTGGKNNGNFLPMGLETGYIFEKNIVIK